MTSTRNAAVAGEIRAEAARQQVSGRELAHRVGKPETTVARYLRGATDMSVDDIELFAAALNVSLVDLITRAYDRTPPRSPSPAEQHMRRLDTITKLDPTNPCLSDKRRKIGAWKQRRLAAVA